MKLEKKFFIGGGRCYSEAHGEKLQFTFTQKSKKGNTKIYHFDDFDNIKKEKFKNHEMELKLYLNLNFTKNIKSNKVLNSLSKNLKCSITSEIFDIDNKVKLNL